jgi:hypothetical protein
MLGDPEFLWRELKRRALAVAHDDAGAAQLVGRPRAHWPETIDDIAVRHGVRTPWRERPPAGSVVS